MFEPEENFFQIIVFISGMKKFEQDCNVFCVQNEFQEAPGA